MHFPREKADQNSRDDPLDRRADHNSDKLRTRFRCKPGRQTVENSPHTSEDQSKHHFVHRRPPRQPYARPLILLLNAQPNSFSAAATKAAKRARSNMPEPARWLPDNGSPSGPLFAIRSRDKPKPANRLDIAQYRRQGRSPTHNVEHDLPPSLFAISRRRLSEQIRALHLARSHCLIDPSQTPAA